jgi:hypothetical protein
MKEIQIIESMGKIILRNSIIIFCSTLGSIILFSPARHFSEIAVTSILHGVITVSHARDFGIFCGIASVAATAILGFNSWDKILNPPEKNFKALLKRTLFYLGGIACAIPLMIDTFDVNQSSLSVVTNLIITLLPGFFISGVYGQSIEFLYNEFTKKNVKINKSITIQTERERLQRYVSLGIGVFLGIISAAASYWEGFNILNPLISLTVVVYIISVLPVVCRAPLFIKSTYNISNNLLNVIINRRKPSYKSFALLVIILLFSLFTIGAYSDIAYNGMTQSILYRNFPVFRDFVYPLLLGVAMFCMLLLNADALLVASERVSKYFSRHGYDRYFIFRKKKNENSEKIPLV